MGTDLLAVEIETTTGARYIFPDVARAMLENALQFGAWGLVDNVILVNIHGACISVPKRVVTRLVQGEEVFWSNSSNA